MIQETEPLVVSQIEVVHPNCSEPNGHIEFQVDNYREYSISWIGETDYSLPFKEKLAPGRYTAEIKRNGSSCNKVLEFEMKAERPLIIIEPVIDVQQADCSGTKAAIRLDLDASMDSLFWNSGFLGSSPDALGLGSGLYHFSLKDTNNCMVQTEVIINSLSDAGVFFSPIIQDSCNRHVGSIELHYYSPSAMAQSNWVLPAQSQSNMLRNLGKGKYPFAINYPGGCVLKDSFEIINETPLLPA
ncbi:MAG: hypothetical protein IPN74_18010 [Haliscomenobacter sp.]|nr:hypothetical protein [Haliscomenobacter sp.]